MDKLTEKRIEKFREYLKKANESLNNILPIVFNQKDENLWDGDFVIDEKTFNILIKKINISNINENDFVYSTKFGLREKNKINYKKLTDNNTYRSLSTLATIRDCLKKFIIEQQPNALTFTASDDDPTRIKLYQNFSTEIINKNKEYYDFYDIYNNIPIFIICKNNFNILKIKDLYINLYHYYNQWYS